MSKWLAPDSGALIGAVGALIVSFVAVAAAEGGANRRRLKHATEAVALLAALKDMSVDAERVALLQRRVNHALDTYTMPGIFRWIFRLVYASAALMLSAVVLAVTWRFAFHFAPRAVVDGLIIRVFYAGALLGALATVIVLARAATIEIPAAVRRRRGASSPAPAAPVNQVP